MTTAEEKVVESLASRWPARLRFALAVAVLWTALAFGADQTVLTRGLERPVVVAVSDSGFVAAGLVALIIVAATWLGSFLAGRDRGTRPVLAVGVALALWAATGGTIDHWLEMVVPATEPPAGRFYAPLLVEYLYFTAVFGLVFWIAGLGVTDDHVRGAARARATFGFDESREAVANGLVALATSVAVATVLLMVLTGPRTGETYRLQVYFALAVGFLLSTMAARYVTGARHPIWYAAAPFLVGIIAVAYAIWRPAVPPPYDRLATIPAWGPVRPLPIEMISVGVVAVLWALRGSEIGKSGDT